MDQETEHTANQYLWHQFAAQALAGLLAMPKQPGTWPGTDQELAAWAGKLADTMLKEYRQRWPWVNPYQGGHYGGGEIVPDTGHPEYDLFVRVAKSLGLREVQAHEIWSATETAHDSWLGLISRMEEVAKANAKVQEITAGLLARGMTPDTAALMVAAMAYESGLQVPDVDGNGHSVEALEGFGGEELPRGSGGLGGIAGLRVEYVEGPDSAPEPKASCACPECLSVALPGIVSGHDPITGERVVTPARGETISLTSFDVIPPKPEPVALTEPAELPPSEAGDSFISNGTEYRRNKLTGSYEAYRTAPEEAAATAALAEFYAKGGKPMSQVKAELEAEVPSEYARQSGVPQDWQDPVTQERLAERIDHRISGDRSEL